MPHASQATSDEAVLNEIPMPPEIKIIPIRAIVNATITFVFKRKISSG
jgi:hypothetical protein